jgi:hypothetical protein
MQRTTVIPIALMSISGPITAPGANASATSATVTQMPHRSSAD